MTDCAPSVKHVAFFITRTNDYDNDKENILFDRYFTKKNIIQNKCHIYTSYRLVWRLLLRQSTLSLS